MNVYNKVEIKRIIKNSFFWLIQEYNFVQYKAEFLIKVVNNILQGFYFQPSKSKRAICLSVFIQPLFIPEDTINLSYGFRMDMIEKQKEEWIELDEKGIERINSFIKTYGIDFLKLYNTPSSILDNINESKYRNVWDLSSWSTNLLLTYCAAYDNNTNFISLLNKTINYFTGQKLGWMERRISDLNTLKDKVKYKKQKELLDEIVTDMNNKLYS